MKFKRFGFIILSLAIVITASGSLAAYSAGSLPPSPADVRLSALPVGRDLTVQVDNVFKVNGTEKDLGGGICEYSKRFPDSVQELEEEFPYTVYGEVTSVTFFGYNGTAFTKYDFRIIEGFRGDFNAGDTISVIENGGYISQSYFWMSQSKGAQERYINAGSPDPDKLIGFATDGAPLPKVGDRYMLFMNSAYMEKYQGAYRSAYWNKFVYNDKVFSRFESEIGCYHDDNMRSTPNSFTWDSITQQIETATKAMQK